MSDAPERIWIDAAGGRWSPVSGGTQGVEYVRADAIPAAQVTVKPLRYIAPDGETMDQMREHARQDPLAKQGDMKLVWVNEGDLYNHTLSALTVTTIDPAKVQALVVVLDKNGDLIGSPLEHNLRAEWRKVAKHHGLPNDGVVEADLVRAFLSAIAAWKEK